MSKRTSWKTISFWCVFWGVVAIDATAQTFTTLVSFNGTDGSGPSGPLVEGLDGNIYGTTSGGGAHGGGTVFKVTPEGTLTTLYSFCAQTNCTDGSSPDGLVLATDGNFYGTTRLGGANDDGTVFSITPAGAVTTLYNFNGTDGSGPVGPLVLAPDGDFYGTTRKGGANSGGAVFKVTPEGTLTALYSFCAQTNCTDGSTPSRLVQAAHGNFYGTTEEGGANSQEFPCPSGCGTAFEITPAGALTTLYSFCSRTWCTDGYSPEAGLVQATDGNFYGTTWGGGNTNFDPQCYTIGPDSECGTVFKITPEGKLTTLSSFSWHLDGGYPNAGLVQATCGNFYGTANQGGASGVWSIPAGGTLFTITSSGTLTTRYDFCSQHAGGDICTDGSAPSAELLQATDGNFYGTTSAGGTNCIPALGFHLGICGTFFRLSVGLGPFVETLPASGAVRQRVLILGNNLKGATGVSFNGIAARFIVVSGSEIVTTVPEGATTGKVRVTTRSAMLISNVAFQVTPCVTGPGCMVPMSQ